MPLQPYSLCDALVLLCCEMEDLILPSCIYILLSTPDMRLTARSIMKGLSESFSGDAARQDCDDERLWGGNLGDALRDKFQQHLICVSENTMWLWMN